MEIDKNLTFEKMRKEKEHETVLKKIFNDKSLERALKIERLKIKIACGDYYIPEGEVARKILEYFAIISTST